MHHEMISSFSDRFSCKTYDNTEKGLVEQRLYHLLKLCPTDNAATVIDALKKRLTGICNASSGRIDPAQLTETELSMSNGLIALQ